MLPLPTQLTGAALITISIRPGGSTVVPIVSSRGSDLDEQGRMYMTRHMCCAFLESNLLNLGVNRLGIPGITAQIQKTPASTV